MELDPIIEECRDLLKDNKYEITENGLTLTVIMHMSLPKLRADIRDVHFKGDFNNFLFPSILSTINIRIVGQGLEETILKLSGFKERVKKFKKKLGEVAFAYDEKNWDQVRNMVVDKAVNLHQKSMGYV